MTPGSPLRYLHMLEIIILDRSGLFAPAFALTYETTDRRENSWQCSESIVVVQKAINNTLMKEPPESE